MSFEDGGSDEIFAKRRKSLFVVSTLTLIIASASPDFSQLEIFNVEFEFEGKEGFVWAGLTAWFIYATFRTITYYWDYLRENVRAERKLYIYWEKHRDYWSKIVQESRVNVIDEYNKLHENKIHCVGTITQNGASTEQIKNKIIANEIPGRVEISYKIELRHREFNNTVGVEEEKREVHFYLDRKHWWLTTFRRLRYIFTDDWWEYQFAQFYAAFCFTMLCATLYHLYW